MAGSIRFSGTCPSCGTVRFVPVEMLGQSVRCHGCGAEFQSSTSEREAKSHANLDSRVDSLLAAADRQLAAASWTDSHTAR